jgi:hypothetical protein
VGAYLFVGHAGVVGVGGQGDGAGGGGGGHGPQGRGRDEHRLVLRLRPAVSGWIAEGKVRLEGGRKTDRVHDWTGG